MNKTEFLAVRVEDETARQVERARRQEKLSRSQWLRLAIEDRLRRQGKRRRP